MREPSKKWSFYSHRVRIRIEGFRLDQLLDRAARKGILLRDLRMHSETELEAWIARSDLKALKKLAHSTYRITPIYETGPRFLGKQLLQDPLKLLGITLAVGVIIVQSRFVAKIEVDGYRAIPETQLRLCLEQSGITEGVYLPAIDWESAEASLYETFPQLVWVQLGYDGRLVVLNVSETDHRIISSAEDTETADGEEDPERGYFAPADPITRQLRDPVSIVADRSGYIDAINALWGEAKVEPGDYVKKGTVLISGAVTLEPTTFEEDAPTVYYVRAEGEVWARVPYRLTFGQERYVAGTDGANLVASRRERTEDEIFSRTEQQIRLWSQENLPEDAEILNKKLNFTPKGNIIEVSVTLEVRQEIGTEEEITIGQKNPDQQPDRPGRSFRQPGQ